MAINIVARRTVRGKLKDLINAAAIAAGYTTYDVLAYAPKTVASDRPTVSVTSAGSDHSLVLEQTNDHYYDFDIWLYVPRTGSGATEEDTLDDWEKLVSRVIEDNPALASYWWNMAWRENGTQATYLLIGGMQYRAELVPVRCLPAET